MLEQLGLRVVSGLLADPEQQDRLVFWEQLDSRGLQVTLDHLDRLDLRDQLDRLEYVEPPDFRVLKEALETLGQPESPDLQDLQDQVALQVK